MNSLIATLLLFAQLAIQPYLNLFNFQGRSNRLQFNFTMWVGGWLTPLVLLLLMEISKDLIVNNEEILELVCPYFSIPLIMAWAFTAWSVSSRRLHDVSQSGFLVLLHLIPPLGLGLTIYLSFKKGDEGENAFGPAPFGPYPTRPLHFFRHDNQV